MVVKQQVPMYSRTDLLSQIGGCLGLWLGMSVITVVELFNLALKIFMQVALYFFCQNKIKTQKKFNGRKIQGQEAEIKILLCKYLS